MAELVCIRRFPDWEEAAVARSALQAAGVSASLREDHYLGNEPFARVALGGFGLMVPSYDASSSDRFLRDVAAAPLINADVPCALCGGTLLRRPVNRLWAIVSFIAGSAFASRRPELWCVTCGQLVKPDRRPLWTRMAFTALGLAGVLFALGFFLV